MIDPSCEPACAIRRANREVEDMVVAFVDLFGEMMFLSVWHGAIVLLDDGN